ncbi:MAG: glycosyltransferase family 4 protein [Patulibacter sp.]|nr:glycosyltransferase family 4 protein [Patulibacter sp.]
MRVQLWSSNYDPEPQGIAPLSAAVAKGLKSLGHEVSVVAAHPHYPAPAWGRAFRPYREVRDDVPVLRLPLWFGRDSGRARIRQDLSFTVSQAVAAVSLDRPDIILAVSPSMPALSVVMATSRVRNVPWVMWLQDIVTDGAATTGQLSDDGALLRAARRFERSTYRSASRVVAISDAFRDNLVGKGVPSDHIVRIFNPTSRMAEAPNDIAALADAPATILAMGNIGHSQGLDKIVDAFQGSDELRKAGTRLLIAGTGVEADHVASRITSDAVQMPGVFYGDEFVPVLRSASIGLVSQRPDITEFNLPSKLMNYMAWGIPVLASVDPHSETARIVRDSGAGWVTDAARPADFAALASRVVADRDALAAAGRRGFDYAQQHFSPEAVSRGFERVLADVLNPKRALRAFEGVPEVAAPTT